LQSGQGHLDQLDLDVTDEPLKRCAVASTCLYQGQGPVAHDSLPEASDVAHDLGLTPVVLAQDRGRFPRAVGG